MKKINILLSVIFFTSVLYAQEDTPCFSRSLDSGFDLGLSFGAVIFNGDIKQYKFIPASQEGTDNSESFNTLRYSLGLNFRTGISEKMLIDFSLSIGEMAGLIRYVGDDDHPDDKIWPRDNIYDPHNNFDGNGEKFENEFRELNISLILPIEELNQYLGSFGIAARIGVGLSIFRTYKSDLYTNEYIYSYGYKDDVNGIGKDTWSQAPKEAIFIFGVLAEYAFEQDVNLMLDFTYKSDKSDTWDASQATNNKDGYFYLGLGVSHHF